MSVRSFYGIFSLFDTSFFGYQFERVEALSFGTLEVFEGCSEVILRSTRGRPGNV